MAVPWLQIVQLVPSIVEVSRELLKRTNKMAPPAGAAAAAPQSRDEIVARIGMLEENERRQALLVSQMAEQLAALTKATTILHRRIQWLGGVAIAAAVVAIIALGLAVGR
jgi:hypothetical protein